MFSPHHFEALDDSPESCRICKEHYDDEIHIRKMYEVVHSTRKEKLTTCIHGEPLKNRCEKCFAATHGTLREVAL